MHIKKNFIFIIPIFCLLIFSSCNQRPSPQEVAQLILDINSCNYLAVEKTIKKNKNILENVKQTLKLGLRKFYKRNYRTR